MHKECRKSKRNSERIGDFRVKSGVGQTRSYLAIAAIAVLLGGCFDPAQSNKNCSTEGLCPGSMICGTDNACHDEGFCDERLACTSSEESYCDIATHTCIETPSDTACNRAEACGGQFHCTNRSDGVCVSCNVDVLCSDAECDPTLNCQCKPGAEGDSLCALLNPLFPVCISEATCGGCTEGDDCPSLFCNIDTGTCELAETILYVDKNAEPSDPATCTRDEPCQRISDAIALVNDARKTILVLPGTYTETVVAEAIDVSIFAEGEVLLLSPPNIDALALKVGSQASVFISGLSIRGSVLVDGSELEFEETLITGGSPGIRVKGAVLIVERSVLRDNETAIQQSSGGQSTVSVRKTRIEDNRIGLEFFSGMLDLRQSSLIHNDKAIGLQDARVTIENNVFADNKIGVENFFANGQLMFNTFYRNEIHLRCPGLDFLLQVHSAIFASGEVGAGLNSNEGCDISFSLFDRGFPGPGIGNIVGIPGFVDEEAGDFRLLPDSDAVDLARMNDHEVVDDFDGMPRPRGAGFDMGAFELQN